MNNIFTPAKPINKSMADAIAEAMSKPVSQITMDIPLFIRALEFAREDAKDDEELHVFTTNAINIMKNKKVLGMIDYSQLIKK